MLKPRQYNRSYGITINEYRQSHVSAVPKDAVAGEGIVIQYPSVSQTTIAQGRDFYVIGKITKELPQNAKMEVTLTELRTGKLLRKVYTGIKDNQRGMYVDYEGITISGDKNEFRKSCMPDLVYDPDDVSTFFNTWNKCYFTDSVFTCLIYGGTYDKDINEYDENGVLLTELPLGDYILKVAIGDYIAEQRITIGTIPNKILARFHPWDHRENVIAEADRMGYTMFLDPFPGYWDTMMFNPEWGVDYIADNPRRWKRNDALEYADGKIHLYIYDTKASSTSFSVELGYMQYHKDIENPDRLEVHYYSVGDVEGPIDGIKGNFWRFTDMPKGKKGPIYLTRVDFLNEPITNNFETTKDDYLIRESSYDLEHLPLRTKTSYGVYTFRILGVCRPIQTNNIIENVENSNYTYTNNVARIEYIFVDEEGTQLYHLDDEDNIVKLTRAFPDDTRETSILEFAHVFRILHGTLGNAKKIFLKYRILKDDGKYLPESGEYISIAAFDIIDD